MKLFSKPTEQSVAIGIYKHTPILRLISLLAIGLLLFALAYTLFFMYKSVYASIGQVKTIIFLKSEVGIETIDFNRLKRVAAAWREKFAATSTMAGVRDPFM